MPDQIPAAETFSRAPVSIRRASVEDLHEITTIWIDGQVAHGLEAPDLNQALDVFRARIERQTEAYGIWVAEVEDVIVGWQSLHRSRANPLWNWAESSTYISAQSRGRGVGRKLVAFATEHAKAVDLSHVVGFIRKGNKAPIKIVESLGWQKVGSIPVSNPSDIEWLYYVYAVPREWPGR
jgi:L-amino acid N-acyltransferase YncA